MARIAKEGTLEELRVRSQPEVEFSAFPHVNVPLLTVRDYFAESESDEEHREWRGGDRMPLLAVGKQSTPAA